MNIRKILTIIYYYLNLLIIKIWLVIIRLIHAKYLTVGKGFRAYGFPIFKFESNSRLIIGNNVTFTSRTKINMAGIYKPCSFAVSKNATMIIGDDCGFSGVSVVCTKSIKIGNHLTCGANVSIWDTDFHPIDYIERRKKSLHAVNNKEIIIGDDVFIGANSIILKGVKIGKCAVIGAGSVVTKEIFANEIWAGNPAIRIK
jgi:acetyltransferase-like isoleucine patch superfamily enzyme